MVRTNPATSACMSTAKTPPPPRGRGSALKPDSRFAEWQREHFDDGWSDADERLTDAPQTILSEDNARSVITFNRSPDVPVRPLDQPLPRLRARLLTVSRPSHAYLGFAGPRLRDTAGVQARRGGTPARGAGATRLSLRTDRAGVNTDAWQPIERRLGVTRSILEVLAETRHPVSIVTKGVLIERDLDLLAELAADGLAEVMISVTTLDKALARKMEPRAPTPERRLEMIGRLQAAGVPVGVLMAPLIPALNDHELERVLEAASAAGAQKAGYVLLRLPHELRALFADWLESHYPQRSARILNRLRELRGGELNNTEFGTMHARRRHFRRSLRPAFQELRPSPRSEPRARRARLQSLRAAAPEHHADGAFLSTQVGLAGVVALVFLGIRASIGLRTGIGVDTHQRGVRLAELAQGLDHRGEVFDRARHHPCDQAVLTGEPMHLHHLWLAAGDVLEAILIPVFSTIRTSAVIGKPSLP